MLSLNPKSKPNHNHNLQNCNFCQNGIVLRTSQMLPLGKSLSNILILVETFCPHQDIKSLPTLTQTHIQVWLFTGNILMPTFLKKLELFLKCIHCCTLLQQLQLQQQQTQSNQKYIFWLFKIMKLKILNPYVYLTMVIWLHTHIQSFKRFETM